MGVGAAERPKYVHWDKAREIALTWVITIPGSALMAVIIYELAETAIRLAMR